MKQIPKMEENDVEKNAKLVKKRVNIRWNVSVNYFV